MINWYGIDPKNNYAYFQGKYYISSDKKWTKSHFRTWPLLQFIRIIFEFKFMGKVQFHIIISIGYFLAYKLLLQTLL